MRDYTALLLLSTAVTIATVSACCLAVWMKRELCDYIRFVRVRLELRRAWEARPQRVRTSSTTVEGEIRNNPFGRVSRVKPVVLHMQLSRDEHGNEIRH